MKFQKSLKKILLVIANIFVSSTVAFIITTVASNIETKVYHFLYPNNPWAGLGFGISMIIFLLPFSYIISVILFSKMVIKKEVKENILLAIAIPLVPTLVIVIWNL